jgi:pilus assembly protein Flp/PilA
MLNALTCMLLSFKNDRRGVTALEYGLIASLVAIALIVGATALGTSLNGTFTSISTKI